MSLEHLEPIKANAETINAWKRKASALPDDAGCVSLELGLLADDPSRHSAGRVLTACRYAVTITTGSDKATVEEITRELNKSLENTI